MAPEAEQLLLIEQQSFAARTKEFIKGKLLPIVSVGALAMASLGGNSVDAQDGLASDQVQPPPAGSIIDFQTGKADAEALVNVTSVDANAGWLQLLGPNDIPGAFSSLNDYHDHQTFASLGVVLTDANAKARIKSQSEGHKVVDVQGYFAPGVFTPTPGRMLDTRETSTSPLPRNSIIKLKGEKNTTQLINIAADGVAQPGFVQVLKTCNEVPGASSNLNAEPGQIVNRLAPVTYDENGEACLFVQGSMHVIVDSVGKFAPGAFDMSSAGRALDTRTTTMPGNYSQTVFKGPKNTTVLISLVAMNGKNAGYLQPVGVGDIPGATSSVNIEQPAAGKVAGPIGNLAAVRLDENGEAKILTLTSSDIIVDILGNFAEGAFIDTPDVRALDTRIDPNDPGIPAGMRRCVGIEEPARMQIWKDRYGTTYVRYLCYS